MQPGLCVTCSGVAVAILVDAGDLPASADEARDAVGCEECLSATDGEVVAPGNVDCVGLVAGAEPAIDLVGGVVPSEVAILRTDGILGAVVAGVVDLLRAGVVRRSPDRLCHGTLR